MAAGSIEYWGDSSQLVSTAHRKFLAWFWKCCVIGSLILAVLSSVSLIRMSTYIVLFVGGMYCLHQIRMQRYRVASILAVFLPFGLVSLMLIGSGTLMMPAVTALPVIIVYGGWLLGRRSAILLVSLSVVLVAGVGLYVAQGGVTMLEPPVPLAYAATLSFYFLFAWGVGRLSEQSYAERTRQAEVYAFRDQLTNLPNRNLLLDRLAEEIRSCQQKGHFSALVLVDIKSFQLINNSAGHKAGDLLLQQVAQRLLLCGGHVESLARVGGDVFAFLCRDAGPTQQEAVFCVEGLVKKIFERFDQRFMIDNTSQHCDVALGASLFGKDTEDSIELLREVELAVSESKRTRGHTFSFYDKSLQELATQRATIEECIRQAVKQKQFELFYQPQFSGNRLVGVEALIRWQHPTKGMISPAEFIPVAEESGLIVAIGKWVLQEACSQIKLWQAHPQLSSITVAVNVSAAQIAQPDFSQQVQAIVAEAGILPERLKLELTESAFVMDAEEVVQKMRSLRAAGILFSLDDFGTGYSSLSYLKRLPLDQLKIDQMFVRDLLISDDDATIAKTIIHLAREFGLEVIAEGVETAEQRDLLKLYGCETHQGYLYSRPVKRTELEAFVESLSHAA